MNHNEAKLRYAQILNSLLYLNHIFIYLILTKLLSLFSIFSSLTIYLILNTYYLHWDNPHNSICVFNLTYSLQCWSKSNFVSPPTTETILGSIKRQEGSNLPRCKPLLRYCTQGGLHHRRFDPSRLLIEPRIWIYAGFKFNVQNSNLIKKLV